MTDDYTLIPITEDIPAGADFCFVMDGDEMEPLIKKGARVYISRREAPTEMEAGLFLYRGQVLCRQFCEDYGGNLLLLCANPKAEGRNLCLDKTERQHCKLLGKVLLKKKAKRPVYE